MCAMHGERYVGRLRGAKCQELNWGRRGFGCAVADVTYRMCRVHMAEPIGRLALQNSPVAPSGRVSERRGPLALKGEPQSQEIGRTQTSVTCSHHRSRPVMRAGE